MAGIKSITEQVYQAIYNDILNGTLKPGDKLTLKTLEESLGVSSSPIRESLNRLLSDGLIDYQPNIGMKIRTYSEKEIRDLFQLMACFDAMALELAMGLGHTEELLDELALNLKRTRTMMGTACASEWNAETDQFHNCIWKYAGNTFLLEAAEKARVHVTIFANRYGMLAESREAIQNAHEKICQLMKDGRTAEAAAAMKEHVNNSGVLAVKVFQAKEEHPSI